MSRRQAGHIRRFASYIPGTAGWGSGTCPLSTGGASFQNCYQDPPGVSSLTEVGSIRESCYPASRAEVQSPRQDGNSLCVNPLPVPLPLGAPGSARIACQSYMKTAPEAYHVCAEKGASLCKAPSWVLLLQSTVSPPTLESSLSHTRACLAFLSRYPLQG